MEIFDQLFLVRGVEDLDADDVAGLVHVNVQPVAHLERLCDFVLIEADVHGVSNPVEFYVHILTIVLPSNDSSVKSGFLIANLT